MVLEGSVDAERRKGLDAGVGAQRQRNWGRTCEHILPKTRQERSGVHQLKSSLAAALVALLGARKGHRASSRAPRLLSEVGKNSGGWSPVLILPAPQSSQTSNLSVPEESVDSDTFLMKSWSLIIAAETNIDG